jgi:archaellum component FlaC
LQNEVRRVEEEIATLKHEQAQTKQSIQDQLNRVQRVERQVEDAANSCSMVTS